MGYGVHPLGLGAGPPLKPRKMDQRVASLLCGAGEDNPRLSPYDRTWYQPFLEDSGRSYRQTSYTHAYHAVAAEGSRAELQRRQAAAAARGFGMPEQLSRAPARPTTAGSPGSTPGYRAPPSLPPRAATAASSRLVVVDL